MILGTLVWLLNTGTNLANFKFSLNFVPAQINAKLQISHEYHHYYLEAIDSMQTLPHLGMTI